MRCAQGIQAAEAICRHHVATRLKIPSSMEREYWTEALTEAEQELEAAATRSGLNAAAKKLMRARQR
jgi:hypothetical protein